MHRYTPNPILVVIDVEPKELGIPTEAYYAVEETHDTGKASSWTFEHVPSLIDAEEAEEIGVEHLLRDIRDHSMSASMSDGRKKGATSHALEAGTSAPPASHKVLSESLIAATVPLAAKVSNAIGSLRSLVTQLHNVQAYLKKVLDGQYPLNQHILAQLQEIFNLLPDLVHDTAWRTAITEKSNDAMSFIYLASLVRSILSIHTLIDNKLHNREEELKADDTAALQAKKEKPLEAS